MRLALCASHSTDSITSQSPLTQQLNNPIDSIDSIGRNHSRPVVNALSVDVEEYYHATIFREATRGLQGQSPSRVVAQTERLLALFATHGAAATFFILGEVAASHPTLVRRIAAAGHEIACHGYHHDVVHRQRPDEFREDVRSAKLLLEDLTGQQVLGYRAPSFSITTDQAWAYDILLELGFSYDSSSYPIRHDRYGDARGPRFPYTIRDHGVGRLLEFPIGTARLLATNLPIGGGGYFRLLPLAVVRWGIRRVNRSEGAPVLFYIHPWEVDPGLPRPPMAWRHRFRHYVGLARTTAKLNALLHDFPFTTVHDVLGLRRGVTGSEPAFHAAPSASIEARPCVVVPER
jgi:polysaccharide deacetylase family protein (PEP-CTERM system associated)